MGLRRFLLNVGSYNLAQLGASFLQFAWAVYLANYVGSGEYGKYAAVVAFVGMFASLMDFGMEIVVVRDVARQKELGPKYATGLAVSHAVLNLVVAAVIVAAFWMIGFPRELHALVLLFYASSAISNLTNVATILFQAFEKFTLIGVLSISKMIGTLLLGAAALFRGYGIFGVFVAYVVSSAIFLVVTWSIALRQLPAIEFKLDLGFLKHLIIQAAPLGLVAFFSTVYFRVDRVILTKMSSLEIVGWYSVAFMMAQALIDLTWSGFNKVIYPVLSRVSSGKDDRLSKITEVLVLVFAILLTFSCVIISSFSREIIAFFYHRPDFRGAADALRVLIWVALPTILWAIYRNVLLVKRKHAPYAALSGAGMAVNIALNVLFIHHWGYIGAAYAAILTQGLLLSATYFCVHSMFGNMLPLRGILKVALAGAGFAMAVWAFRRAGDGLLAVPVLSLAYAATILLMGVVRRADLTAVGRTL